jgi:nicotinamidase-related amidase
MQNINFDPARAVMIVVDMQNDFVAAGAPMETPDARAMVPRLAESLALCRAAGVRVIYTAQVHRPDGSDFGEFAALHAPVMSRKALIDGTPGVEIYPELAPLPGEHVIKKHRYSAFFGTDLDIVLRAWGIETVIISGTTTENCCLSTARDALYNNYHVLFLSDATATCDYPDRGFGAMQSTDLHQATLMVIAASTGEVVTVAELGERLDTGKGQLARAS